SDIGKDRLRPQDEIIEARTSNPRIRPEDCLGVAHSDPSTVVIVGATGDLTARKLVPALFNLYLNDGLPDSFRIVGCGRTKLNDQQFRGKMEKALMAKGNMDDSKWQAFSDLLHYRSVDYGELDSFISLAKFLRK
ncbi:glucose-6-phosphate dehydrogenase, partial [Desulfobacteraceae bacterium SEEP-SAG9]